LQNIPGIELGGGSTEGKLRIAAFHCELNQGANRKLWWRGRFSAALAVDLPAFFDVLRDSLFHRPFSQAAGLRQAECVGAAIQQLSPS
jgi:hypothetical protein